MFTCLPEYVHSMKTIEIRREPLPKSGAGKVLKTELRKPFWAGQSRGIH